VWGGKAGTEKGPDISRVASLFRTFPRFLEGVFNCSAPILPFSLSFSRPGIPLYYISFHFI